MLYHLTRVAIEVLLCAFGIVDDTERRLRNTYKAIHGKG